MSNETNDQLLERAANQIDVWEGTAIAKVIRRLVERNELDQLRKVVVKCEQDMVDEFYRPNDEEEK